MAKSKPANGKPGKVSGFATSDEVAKLRADVEQLAGKSGPKSGSEAWYFKSGYDPRRGRGPRPGTGGRPRAEFKAALRALASNPKILKRLEDLLATAPDPGTFLNALKYVTEHGYGKATQPVRVEQDDAGVRRELAEMSDDEVMQEFQRLRAQPSKN